MKSADSRLWYCSGRFVNLPSNSQHNDTQVSFYAHMVQFALNRLLPGGSCCQRQLRENAKENSFRQGVALPPPSEMEASFFHHNDTQCHITKAKHSYHGESHFTTHRVILQSMPHSHHNAHRVCSS